LPGPAHVDESSVTFRASGYGEEGTEMAGKFEIYKDSADQFRWRLKASNGEIIANPEGYTTKDNAKNGIESVKSNAPDASTEDLT
jgi:uncharacterized protein